MMGGATTRGFTFGLWMGSCLFLATVMFVALPTTQDAKPVEAVSGLQEKLNEILQNAATTERPVPAVVISEVEINDYLEDEGGEFLPGGVTDPRVGFEESELISTRATVDLAAVSASRSRGALDPLRYLAGRLPVSATGFLRTDAGTGRLQIQRVTVAGLPVPHTVLQEIVRQYTKSDVNPNGVELTEPFELPYQIREVRVRQAELVVEQ